ncbi:MAG: hypothetical protein ACE5MI_10655 [Acidimicrobiia bacterium]
MSDRPAIAAVLNETEKALKQSEGADLKAFWNAVGVVKRDPELVQRHADQIGVIDKLIFERWEPLVRVGASLGTVLAVVGTAAGLGLVAAGYYLTDPWNGVAILAGVGVLLGTTHGLGHVVVGGLVGIRFISWFVASIRSPQPGLKTDKASYVRTAARPRAWMHAAGAIVTKLVPFLMLGPALASGAPSWTWIVLLVIGFGQFVSDAVWSTKTSDWMRYSREMAIARELES